MQLTYKQINYYELKRYLKFDVSIESNDIMNINIGQYDLNILGEIFKNTNPRRHLEFGTWMGKGVLTCLENCNATVWTINKPFGEDKPNGEYAYGHEHGDKEIIDWADKARICSNGYGWYKTDSLGFIGKEYLKADMGHRVCQIYTQSDNWDTKNYPNGFFDTVFIDGGHTKEIVINDTKKSLPLLASGGIMIWHDYIPQKGFIASCDGVIEAIESMKSLLNDAFDELYYIKNTLILLGRKK